MDLGTITDGADRFVAYVEDLTSVIGHADRASPLRNYCAGLLAAEGRKGVEPTAAVTAPAQISVQHQKLLHFVGGGKWSDDSVLAKVRELVIPAIERHGPIKAWIIDEGTHSVGVHHQYCGQFGKQADCQVAVTLSIANHRAGPRRVVTPGAELRGWARFAAGPLGNLRPMHCLPHGFRDAPQSEQDLPATSLASFP
jgi:SRSO17 transposase